MKEDKFKKKTLPVLSVITLLLSLYSAYHAVRLGWVSGFPHYLDSNLKYVALGLLFLALILFVCSIVLAVKYIKSINELIEIKKSDS